MLSLKNIELSYGTHVLLDGINLTIKNDERICLLGRNGAGKSSLLALIAGEAKPDDGQIEINSGIRIGTMEQIIPDFPDASVFDVVADGINNVGQLLKDFHHLSCDPNPTTESLNKLGHVQEAIDAADGWRHQQQVERTLSQLRLEADLPFSGLSGGQKRRAMLGRCLVQKPDLLLLDEPTNHLDIQAIEELEVLLDNYPGSLLFISHDRRFVDRIANRIIELDRGNLTSFPGNHSAYLQRKQEQLEIEARENALFDKKLSQEEVWIRQGIKARRTRNEGRVRALQDLRKQRSQRRERQGSAIIEVQAADESGKIVIETDNAGYSWDGTPLFSGLSTKIMRGDRIGILGPNGSGKTTLLKVLLGQLEPTQGQCKLGTKLELAYFDQHRAALDDKQTVVDSLASGRDFVTINGKDKHVISYLQDFLFEPARARQPVKALSGGERNRLLLARLFARPSNLLIMDEPTNDLDAETLDLLEERLSEYQGTLLLVSHDRAFLNNVVTSTLAFEGPDQLNEYVGGYDDWLRQRRNHKPLENKSKPANTAPTPNKRAAKKRSYKEQRELDSLPKLLESLETEINHLQQQMNEADFYQQDKADIQTAQDVLGNKQRELEVAYERWEQLEAD